ncbi:hypothetical protein J6590_034218 [Homalodisca vitripennis]|nr:hypothetical protein J6590_034218 [Homalodisca vitripennis]
MLTFVLCVAGGDMECVYRHLTQECQESTGMHGCRSDRACATPAHPGRDNCCSFVLTSSSDSFTEVVELPPESRSSWNSLCETALCHPYFVTLQDKGTVTTSRLSEKGDEFSGHSSQRRSLFCILCSFFAVQRRHQRHST